MLFENKFVVVVDEGVIVKWEGKKYFRGFLVYFICMYVFVLSLWLSY